MTRQFAKLLQDEPGIRVANQVNLNQLIVSFGHGSAASRRVSTAVVTTGVQQDGTCFAAGAEWRGDWVMRLSIISGETTENDIKRPAIRLQCQRTPERLFIGQSGVFEKKRRKKSGNQPLDRPDQVQYR